jgi:hypothetical protein
MKLPKDLRELIGRGLHARAEEWAGVKLRTALVYGLRRYRNGAWLREHTDRDGNVLLIVLG